MRNYAWTGAAVLLAMATAARAEDAFLTAREEAARQGPEGVTLEAAAGKQFRMGELIRVTLTFRSTVEGASLDTSAANPWRTREQFYVDPREGVSEPLRKARSYVRLPRADGAATVVLGLEARRVEVDVNAAERFDQPGKYRMYVTSARAKVAGNPPPDGLARRVVSNVIEFEILPFDAAWAQGEAAELQKIVEGKADAAQRRNALRRLRALGTAEAAAILARQFTGEEEEEEYEVMAGLLGAADRGAALRTLSERLVAPNQPVSSRFLSTLQGLDLMSRGVNVRGGRRVGAAAQDGALQQERDEALGKYVDALVENLPRKNWPARAACLVALQQMPAIGLDRAPDAKLAEAMSEVFEKLTRAEQVDVLRGYWVRVRTPALLPSLKVLVSGKQDTSEGGQTLRNWALVRTYELDPAWARELVLEEMKRPGQALQVRLAGRSELMNLLPDATLPQLDAAFVELVKGGDFDETWGGALMISRYGSPAILEEMKKIFEPNAGRWACSLQAPMLAYFLRVDEGYGIAMFRRCLASRQTGCWRTLFREVGRLQWTPMLEKLATESLDDPEADIAMGAASMLGVRGSAGSKAALLAALQRPYTPGGTGTTRSGQDSAVARRGAIVAALLNAHAWELSEEEVAAVTRIAGDETALRRYKSRMRDGVGVTVGVGGDGKAIFRLNSPDGYESLEALEKRVAMLPAGVAVHVEGKPWEANYQAFMAWARERGLRVE